MFLRQSTSQAVNFGPFLDSTDGVTAETGLTIAQADMQLSKDGGTYAQKSAAGNATHDVDGHYTTTLSTTDTGTTGVLRLQVNVTGALPVWETFFVLTATAYDSLHTGTYNNVAATDIVSAGAITTLAGAVANVDLVDTLTTYTGNTPQTANHTAAIADIPTVAEFNARTLAAADYFDPAADTVANVTLVATTTTNTDMRGTDNAFLAASAPTNFSNMSISVTTGLVDITQTAADKAWSTAARTVTAPTNITSDGAAINATAGVINTVNLTNTTTTNTDMRGTDNALLAASINLTAGAVDTVTDITNQVTADTTAIAGDATAATNLSKSAIGIEPGAAITGTLSTTQMTTNLTEATDDHYIGRIIIWTSGVLKNQATDITDYDGTSKLLTYTATTEAPSNTDTFVIV